MLLGAQNNGLTLYQPGIAFGYKSQRTLQQWCKYTKDSFSHLQKLKKKTPIRQSRSVLGLRGHLGPNGLLLLHAGI